LEREEGLVANVLERMPSFGENLQLNNPLIRRMYEMKSKDKEKIID
jgi:hypothetical protein